MKLCPLCENQIIELHEFQHLRIWGLSPSDILFLRQFYICQTGDKELKKLADRTTEKGFQG